MAATYTTELGIPKPGLGDATWKTQEDLAKDLVDEAIGGYISQALDADGSTDISSMTDGASHVARHHFIKFTGALTADETVILPAIHKDWWIENGSTGGYSLSLSIGSTTVDVGPGQIKHVQCDGTDILEVTLPSLLGQNVIINSAMRFAQRGTSFAAPANNDYTLDRWQYLKSGVVVHTVSQDSSVVPSDQFTYSLKLDVTTADPSIISTDYAGISYKIEGYDYRRFIGQIATLGFWIRSPKTGIHAVSFMNPASNRTLVSEYTIAVADTWEFHTITLTLETAAATSHNTSNNEGLRIIFPVMTTGSSGASTGTDAWEAGVFIGSGNEVNCADNTANNIYLAGVQFELGAAFTSFDHVSYALELARCQRYMCKSYNIDTAPGTATVAGSLEGGDTGTAAVTASVRFTIPFPVPMRAGPTLTLWNTSGTLDQWNNQRTNPAQVGNYENRSIIEVYPTASASDRRYAGHFRAISEL